MEFKWKIWTLIEIEARIILSLLLHKNVKISSRLEAPMEMIKDRQFLKIVPKTSVNWDKFKTMMINGSRALT